jgi:hypothetical protein
MPDMKQWEYMLFDSRDVERKGLFGGEFRKHAESLLNAVGAEGWEVVNIDWRELEGRMSFSGVAKREKTQA